MSDIEYSDEQLTVLESFLADYGGTAGPEQVLTRYCSQYPDLAEEFRLQAGFERLLGGATPAELPDILLLRQIGEGGMGVVFEGWQESLRRPVAVKLCWLHAARDGRERFLRECRTLAQLHQTAIVPIHAAGRSGDWLYAVMPLIQGATLKDLLSQARQTIVGSCQPLPALADMVGKRPGVRVNEVPDQVDLSKRYLDSVISTMLAVAEALTHAHAAGVVHGDVKPANIMLQTDGRCWLIDFGLARKQSEATSGPAGGTPGYAAPELDQSQPTPAADVWGLGVTLYELLTLHKAFPGETPDKVRLEVQRASPRRPRQYSPAIPIDLEAICLKSLALDPASRYASAAGLTEDLRLVLAGRETSARTWSLANRFAGWVRRNRPLALTGLVTLVALVVTFLSLWLHGRALAEARLTQEKLILAADSQTKLRAWSLLHLARERLREPVFGRIADVRRLLRTAARERLKLAEDSDTAAIDRETRSLLVASLALNDVEETAMTPLPYVFFYPWIPDIHPGGKLLALGTAESPVVWSQGKSAPFVPDTHRDKPHARVQYSRTGAYLVEVLPAESGGGLRVWDREASRILAEPLPRRATGGAVLAVGFDPADRHLWVVRGSELLTWELPGFKPGTSRNLTEVAPGNPSAASFTPDLARLAIGNDRGQVIVISIPGSEPPRTLDRSPDKNVTSLAWSPDGQYLAIGAHDGIARVLHVDGTFLYRVSVCPFGVDNLFFSPDGRWLLAWHRSSARQMYDAHTGKVVLAGQRWITAIARDGVTCALADPNNMGFGRITRPDGLYRGVGHRAAVHQLCWSQDSKRLVTLDSAFVARIWDIEGGCIPRSEFCGPPAHRWWAEQSAVALSADGQQLAYASGGEERSVAVIWDVATRKQLARWELPGGFEQLAAAERGFLSVREEIRSRARNVTTVIRTLRPGDTLTEGKVLRSPEEGDTARFLSHHLTPDGKHYIWCGPRRPHAKRRIEILEVASGKRLTRIPTKTATDESSPVWTISPDVQQLFVDQYADRAAVVYDLTSSKPGKPAPLRIHAWSADQSWRCLALPYPDNSAKRYPALAQGKDAQIWLDFSTVASGILPGRAPFSPSGRYLVLAGPENSILVADLDQVQMKVAAFEASVRAVGRTGSEKQERP